MNKNFMYRMIGAIASALIIVSVFIPFVKVTGFSQSLWQEFSEQSVYLPILIIIFGVIGVIFFALNFKTEFAYATAGGVSFYIIMRTIDIINQNVFNTLSIGYYFLIIGTLLTAIMAFLCNKDSKDNMEMAEANVNDNLLQQMPLESQSFVSNQISNINEQNIPFNNQVFNQSIQEVNDQVPMPDISFDNVSSINESLPIQDISNINIGTPLINNVESISPVNTQFSTNSIPEFNQDLQNQINPIPEFNQDLQSQINSIPQMNNTISNENNIPLNPVVSEFTNQPVNPVVQEFMGVNTQTSLSRQESINQPINNLQENSNVNGFETDIFGQPINRN